MGKIITADFETYYDKEYSLSKMTTEAYIRDDRFEPLILTLMVDDSDVYSATGDDIPKLLKVVDLSDKAFCAHNAAFDAAILSFRYGIKPAVIFDTLSMARPKHAMTTGCSLAALAKAYSLPDKGTEVISALGKHKGNFTYEEWKAYTEYCKHDTWLCRQLFKTLVKDFSVDELKLIDTTIRMYTEPLIELDRPVLVKHLAEEQARKADLVSRLGLPAGTSQEEAKAILMSNDKFAEYLTSLGVEPPTKVSARTGKTAWAFSKTDLNFKELLNSEDDRVVNAVEARLGVKTTIEETRTERLLDAETRGALPVMLNYYGAHTGRYSSGGEKNNIQNYPRGGALRQALTLPKGLTMMACDLSQIEARVNAYIAGQTDTLNHFRNGEDIYCAFGSRLYGRKITKADKQERLISKCAVLGLGYGMGKAKFELYAKQQGIPMPPDQAERVVGIYRSVHDRIRDMWGRCDLALNDIMCGRSGMIGTLLPYDANGIKLPNGLYIRYPLLRQLPDGKRGYRYVNNPRAYKAVTQADITGDEPAVQWTYIYGAKTVENCCRKGTLVLTSSGWKPIETVTTNDLVYDGVDYVPHSGVVHKGVQSCIEVDGAWFTPEHRILENGTWKEASFIQRPDRPEIRYFNGDTRSKNFVGKTLLDMAMRLWQGRIDTTKQDTLSHKERERPDVLGMYTQTNVSGTEKSWHVSYSILQRMAQYAPKMYRAYTLCVGTIWGAGGYLLRKMGEIREFLRGYVPNIQAGACLRPSGQQQGVLAGELPMGFLQNEQSKQTECLRGRGCISSIEGNRDKQINYLLQDTTRVSTRDAGVTCWGITDRRVRVQIQDDVYDILNCGPRRRFVCRGTGQPMIAHNCVQALARIIVTEMMNVVAKRYKVLFQVHDEIVIACRDEEVQEAAQFLEQVMSTPPSWAPDLPVACECSWGKSYKECK